MNDDDVARVLAGARTDRTPPPDLECATLTALRSRGAFAGSIRSRVRRRLMQAMLVAAALAIGVWIGSMRAPRAVPAEPRFLLLVYMNPEYRPDGTGDVAREAEYRAWAEALERDGHLLIGNKVAWGGVEFRPNRPRIERASVPTPDEARGLFVILAPNEQAALAIAETCPHLKYGGRMVLRPMS